jgi:hypothetical protein
MPLQRTPLDTPENLKNSIPGLTKKWLFTEETAYPLTAFWDKRALPEAQDLAEKALPVILSRQLTGPQVVKLVEWVKGGNEVETFGRIESQSPQPEVAQPSTNPKANQPATSPSSQPSPLKGEGEGKPIDGAQGKAVGLGALGGLLVGLFQRQKGIGAASGLGGVLGKFLAQNFKRAMGTLARRWMLHSLTAIGVVLIFSPHLFVSLYHLAFGYGDSKPKASPSAHLPPGSQAGGQDLVVPNRGADGNRGTQMGSVQTASPASEGLNAQPFDKAQVGLSGVSQERVDGAKNIAQYFAKNYFGTDYSDTTNWIKNLNGDLAPGYSQAFFQDFCPPSRIEDIRNRKLLEQFYLTKPVEVLGAVAEGEDLLVEGNAVWKTDLGDWGKVLAKGPVALEVHVVHLPGDDSEGKIGWVGERLSFSVPGVKDDDQASTGLQKLNGKKKGEPIKKAKARKTSQGTTTNMDETVKTIGDTVDTADKAKRLLGF